jgi:N-acyl-D-amino-acid deacylase
MKRRFLLLLFTMAAGVAAHAALFDVMIQNGRIVDGTGAPATHGDVGIRGGKVVAIGKLNAADAEKVIDANGLIVAPGFIDVHTHAEDIVEMPVGENFIRMGVTTLMLGNCGGSELDVEKLMRDVDGKVCPNVATLIGQGTVRAHAMKGSFDRPPTEKEMAQMKELVAKAMKAGAFGLSTGLIYLPGTFSKTEEIVELAKVASDYGGIYVSHMRDEGLEIEDALNELFRIAREAKMRAHVSHIKLSGKSAWGRSAQILSLIERARTEGLDITQDQYTYTASSTGISQLIPDWAREGGKFDERLKDPATKARIKADMLKGLKERGFEDFSYAVIANYPITEKAANGGRAKKDTSFNGLNIVEAARKKFASNSLDDQIEMILQAHKASGVFHSMNEEDMQVFLKNANTMLASDSGVRKFGQGVPHPRGYGNNARAIHRYVNELGVLKLEECVRRMTSLPASAFRVAGRGQIQESFWADIVIFDDKKVEDRATFTKPHQYAAGFDYVLVNGVAVIEKGQVTEKRPGQGVRFHGGEK